MIKQEESVQNNINLLDRAMFIPSRKIAKLQYYSDENGYSIEGSMKYGLPTMFDRLLLASLLSIAQRNNKSVLYFSSVYELIKSIGIVYSGTNLKLVEESFVQ